jgi:hypothetical protein
MMNDFMPYVYLDERLRAHVEADRGRQERASPTATTRGWCARIRIGPGLLYAGTEHGMYISFAKGRTGALPAEPAGDADHGLEGVPEEPDRRDRGRVVLDRRRAAGRAAAEGGLEIDRARCCTSRRTRIGRGPLPTFYYWFKEQPAAPVTLEVKDAAGKVVYTATAQPAPVRRSRRRRRFRPAPARRRGAAAAAAVAARRWGGGGGGFAASAAARSASARRRAEPGDVESAARIAVHDPAAHRHVGRRRRTRRRTEGRPRRYTVKLSSARGRRSRASA